MENVPEVVGKRNRAAWEQWILTLDQMGYKSYWKIINAVNFGIPQNRRRCFMVSVQGDYYYEFPESIGCDIRLRDVLEPIEKVDESYYLSDELIASYMKWSDRHQLAGDGFCFRPTDRDGADKAWCISTKAGSRGGDNFIDESGSVCHKVGDLFGMGFEHMFEQSRRVYGNDGAAPTIHTAAGSETSHKEIKILVEGNRWASGHESGKIINPDGAACTVKENHGEPQTILIKANNHKGYDEMTDGDALDVRYPSSKTRRGRVGHGVAQTVQTAISFVAQCFRFCAMNEITPAMENIGR
jgi:site-specific DNA-cytosine methylase